MLLKHRSQRGKGKTGFLLKSRSVKAFYVAAYQERKYNSKEAEYVLEVISLSPVQQLWRAGVGGCCRGEDNLGWHGAAWHLSQHQFGHELRV